MGLSIIRVINGERRGNVPWYFYMLFGNFANGEAFTPSLSSEFQNDSHIACYKPGTLYVQCTLLTDVLSIRKMSTCVKGTASNGHVLVMSAVVYAPAIVVTIVKLCLSACTVYVIEPDRTTAASVSVTEWPAFPSIVCRYMNNNYFVAVKGNAHNVIIIPAKNPTELKGIRYKLVQSCYQHFTVTANKMCNAPTETNGLHWRWTKKTVNVKKVHIGY